MGNRHTTSRDIAAAAGVSQATVSRALRNSPLVRPETRERIWEVARELNYQVNRNAAGLRTNRSNTLALLLFDDVGGGIEINPFFLAMLGSITRAASRAGYDVLVSFQQLEDDWHMQYEVSNRADGLILLGYGDYREYAGKLDALASANTHFIIWGPMVAGQPGHSLGCDNFTGGHLATRHLAGLGRRRIAYLGNASSGSPEMQERFRGYSKALEEAGLEQDPALVVPADTLDECGYAAAQQLIASGAAFDAVFANADTIAIGALRAFREAGLDVPGDVALVGFDDVPLAAHVTPALTTVRQDVHRAGELLVDTLVQLIEDEPAGSTLITPELVVRASCGAA